MNWANITFGQGLPLHFHRVYHCLWTWFTITFGLGLPLPLGRFYHCLWTEFTITFGLGLPLPLDRVYHYLWIDVSKVNICRLSVIVIVVAAEAIVISCKYKAM